MINVNNCKETEETYAIISIVLLPHYLLLIERNTANKHSHKSIIYVKCVLSKAW